LFPFFPKEHCLSGVALLSLWYEQRGDKDEYKDEYVAVVE